MKNLKEMTMKELEEELVRCQNLISDCIKRDVVRIKNGKAHHSQAFALRVCEMGKMNVLKEMRAREN